MAQLENVCTHSAATNFSGINILCAEERVRPTKCMQRDPRRRLTNNLIEGRPKTGVRYLIYAMKVALITGEVQATLDDRYNKDQRITGLKQLVKPQAAFRLDKGQKSMTGNCT